MIRIEGIPVVAARLADAQKAKSAQARNRRRTTSKIDAGGKAPLAIHSGSTAQTGSPSSPASPEQRIVVGSLLSVLLSSLAD